MELHSANRDPFTASASYSLGFRAGAMVVPGLETRIGKSNRIRFELHRVNHERRLRNTQVSAALILPLGF